MELWQGLTSGTRNRHTTRVSKKRTVARIRYSRGGREASATSIKVAGICTSSIKAEELDSPLAWGAGVVGGAVPTAGAAVAECVIGSREESDKSGRASSAGNQGFGVGRKVAVGISVKRGARIVRVGAVKESVRKGPTPPRWSKVAGRRSIFWSTRDWTMVELAEVEPPRNFFLSAR
jgi:hypothetical protein